FSFCTLLQNDQISGLIKLLRICGRYMNNMNWFFNQHICIYSQKETISSHGGIYPNEWIFSLISMLSKMSGKNSFSSCIRKRSKQGAWRFYYVRQILAVYSVDKNNTISVYPFYN